MAELLQTRAARMVLQNISADALCELMDEINRNTYYYIMIDPAVEFIKSADLRHLSRIRAISLDDLLDQLEKDNRLLGFLSAFDDFPLGAGSDVRLWKMATQEMCDTHVRKVVPKEQIKEFIKNQIGESIAVYDHLHCEMVVDGDRLQQYNSRSRLAAYRQ